MLDIVVAVFVGVILHILWDKAKFAYWRSIWESDRERGIEHVRKRLFAGMSYRSLRQLRDSLDAEFEDRREHP